MYANKEKQATVRNRLEELQKTIVFDVHAHVQLIKKTNDCVETRVLFYLRLET